MQESLTITPLCSTSLLELIFCGEKITKKYMLEKALTTFHPSNVALQQQYREH